MKNFSKIRVGGLFGVLSLMISCGPSVEEKNQRRELRATREELAQTKEEQKNGALSLSATNDLTESVKLTEIALDEGFAQKDLSTLSTRLKPILILSQSEIEGSFREVNKNAIAYTAAASKFLKSVNQSEAMPVVVSDFDALIASNQVLKSKVLKLVQELEAQASLDSALTKELIAGTTGHFNEALKQVENTDSDAKFLFNVTFRGQVKPEEKK